MVELCELKAEYDPRESFYGKATVSFARMAKRNCTATIRLLRI